VILLALLILMAVVSFSFAQNPPPPPPVGHTDLLGTPPGTEMVDAAPVLKTKKKAKKHKVNPKNQSGLERLAVDIQK
jgi:hypothetical protein